MKIVLPLLIAGLPTLITTIGVIATTIIQNKQANKKDSIDAKLTDIKKALENEKLDRCKSDLIVIMSRIQNGYNPTTEEIMVLYETKKKYNELGGDSYVDDMFEKLKKEGKL